MPNVSEKKYDKLFAVKVDDAFAAALERVRQGRGLKHASEAIRALVHEADPKRKPRADK
jgi:hypothetical protein